MFLRQNPVSIILAEIPVLRPNVSRSQYSSPTYPEIILPLPDVPLFIIQHMCSTTLQF